MAQHFFRYCILVEDSRRLGDHQMVNAERVAHLFEMSRLGDLDSARRDRIGSILDLVRKGEGGAELPHAAAESGYDTAGLGLALRGSAYRRPRRPVRAK